MVDFIKVKLIGCNFEELKKKVTFTLDGVDTTTGELVNKVKNGVERKSHLTAEFRGLKIIKYDSGYMTLSGSLHKYLNVGKHNYNDFNFEAFLSVISELEALLGIPLSAMQLTQLEVGINVNLPFNTKEVLESCLNHKKKVFKWGAFGYNSNYIQSEHSQYIIKIYDKYVQYKEILPINKSILRFEVKYRKMEKLSLDLSKFKIYKKSISLSDLIECKLIPFKTILLEQWENVLFYDYTLNIPDVQRDKLSNPNNWKNLKTSNYKKQKANLYELTEYSSEKIQSQIKGFFSNKIEELL
jgi:hypothetical protein